MSNALDELHRMLNTCFSCKRDYFDEIAPTCSMCVNAPNYPEQAPDGQIFVCGACGKRSKALYPCDQSGWDESCMANAVLCFENITDVVPGYEPTRRKGRKF